MFDARVKCDKPYDLDQMDRGRGKPRRRRKDPHTTAYELTIRLNEEQRNLMGKPKYVRVVYALNKREDLKGQIGEFEEYVSGLIRAAAAENGEFVKDSDDTVCGIVRSYLESRRGAVNSRYVEEGLDLLERYIAPTIGNKLFRTLTVSDIEQALRKIPELSRRLNEEKRTREAANRAKRKAEQEEGIDKSGTHYPEFQPIRVAGRPTQHKALSLLKLAGNYALDHGLIDSNIAANKRLSSQFPKSAPKIDNFTEDEARYVYSKIQELPLSARKVEFQLLFMCGIRPCELVSLVFDDIDLHNPHQGVLFIVKRLKTKNAYRNIPLDPDTTALLREWKESRIAFAKEVGVIFSSSWLVCCDDGQKVVYNTLKQRWMYFLKSIGLEHRRPYALRHTFATINGRNNVDVKTLATLMGHANPGFTLSVYSGYIESASYPVTTNYLGFLNEDGDSQD